MIIRVVFVASIIVFSVISTNAAEKLSVFVSIVPQKYFVQQIGKEMVDVKIMVKPGASPATYEPKPRQMADIAKAKLYFAIGVPFENAWLEKISAANTGMKVIHTDHGIDKIAMAAHHHHKSDPGGNHGPEYHGEEHHDGEEHQDKKGHGDGDHHGHAGLDPHIWVSPSLVKVQAKTILKALQDAAPLYKEEFQENYDSFSTRIDALDQELKHTLAGTAGMQFIVFHPSWGYFAKDYGLKQIPIEIEGKDPKPAQLKELIEHAKEREIKVIFVQPQFSTKSAEILAREIGGQVAFADPLAEDWMENLSMIADKFKGVLK
ncbi:MAG: zinc ABC transporter substrate-binding protein [Desulfamplus sp.]|nr:zinc ABC transporter substrate-binding protein [Desulfamplus sp.]